MVNSCSQVGPSESIVAIVRGLLIDLSELRLTAQAFGFDRQDRTPDTRDL